MVCGQRHFAHQVGGDEDRSSLRGQALHKIADPENSLRVQTIDRLVEHQDFRITQQGGGDSQSLPHAERKSFRLLLRHGRQADQVQHFGDALLGDPVRLGQAEKVVVRAATAVHGFRVQQRPDVLQRFRQVPVVLAVDPDPTAGRVVEVEHHAHGRGLPRPVGAEEAGDHPRSDLEAEVVHGGLGAESFGKALKLDHAATLERRRAVRHLKRVTYGPTSDCPY